MTRLASRVALLEQAEEQARKPDQPWWWELPHEQLHLGRVGLSHDEAFAMLDEFDAADEGEPA